MPEVKKPTRGGRRPGAGRKPDPARPKLTPYSLRLRDDLIEWIERNGGRPFLADLIARAEIASRIL